MKFRIGKTYSFGKVLTVSSNNSLSKNVLIIFLVVAVFILAVLGVGIRYNHSESLPERFYFAVPFLDPKSGWIVSFKHPKSKALLAKIVAGMPGDLIEVKENTVMINGVPKGEIAKGMQPIQSQVISEGYFFVLGKHSESFDSRYEQFGLVPQEMVREVLWPIY